MQMWELQRYVNGIQRRYRTEWATARWRNWTLMNMFSKKDTSYTLEDVASFPWEKIPDEPTDREQQEAATRALLEECIAQNKANELAAKQAGESES